MSYELAPSPHLLTPEHWNGIDITNPNNFMGVPDPVVAMTRHESKASAKSLVGCLGRVVQSDFAEAKAPGGKEFDPSPTNMPDGTVVVIDREFLEKWTYNGRDVVWDPADPVGTGTPIGTPFAEHWRSQQGMGPHGRSNHFGRERATFTDEHILYERELMWGVLLSRQRRGLDTAVRYLATWALTAPKALPGGGVFVPVRHMGRFESGDTLPLEPGVAAATPEARLDGWSRRRIERVREIKRIYPNGGTREKVPLFKERLAEALKEGLGSIVIPSPRPLPNPS